MSTAVGVLILDEPEDLSATVRATLEHMPEFHTVGEADLDRADAGSIVALVFLDEIRLADGIARIVALKERQPNLRTLVAFGALTADDLRALLAAGADAFVARSKSPRELGAALLALAEGSDCLVPPEQPVALPAEAGDGLGLTPGGRGAALPQLRVQQQGGRAAAGAQRPHRGDSPAQPAAQDPDRTAEGSGLSRPTARTCARRRERGAGPARDRQPVIRQRQPVPALSGTPGGPAGTAP